MGGMTVLNFENETEARDAYNQIRIAGNAKANAKQMKQKLAGCAVPKCVLGALLTQLTVGLIQMVDWINSDGECDDCRIDSDEEDDEEDDEA